MTVIRTERIEDTTRLIGSEYVCMVRDKSSRRREKKTKKENSKKDNEKRKEVME